MRKYLVFLLIPALYGCAEQTPDDALNHAEPDTKLVRVAPVKLSETGRVFSLTGTTRAANRATLAFQVSGSLAKRPVKIGDQVRKGQLLAELSNPEAAPQTDAARARVRELETRSAQAQRDLARVESLFEREAATQQELETARASADALKAGLASARAQLSRSSRTLAETRLEASVSGTVDRIFFEQGEFVPAGQPVLTLSGDGLLEAEIGVPETLLSAVELGQTARLRLPLFEDREVTGRVSEFSSSAGGPGQLFPVVITLDDSQSLRPGLSVEWLLRKEQPQQIILPVAAVVSPGGSGVTRVFLAKEGKAVAVPIRVGAIIDDHVVVTGELGAGDQVVIAGLSSLVDGRDIEVLP